MSHDTRGTKNCSINMNHAKALAFFAGCIALPGALVLGCGGGGGGSSTGGTSGGSCSLAAYLPNYAPDIAGGTDLRKWDRFPLTVYRKDLSGWSSQDTIAFNAGLNAWRTTSGNQVDFTIATSDVGANIVVEFLDRAFVKDNAVGLTTISYVGSRILECTVQIANRNSSGSPRNQTELNKIMLHEIGHALGIGGHSSVNTDIMYAFVAPSSPTTPTQSDWNTLRTAYCDAFGTTRGPVSPIEGPVKTIEIACPADHDH